MARIYSGKRPKNLRRTFGSFVRYLGRHRLMLVLVAILAAVSALANLLGTYMIKPIVNRFVVQGDMHGLMFGVGVTAAIYAVGALSTLGYTQMMVRAADKGIRIGNAGRPLHLLLGGVQLSKADVIRNGSGKQVSILQDDPKGAAQISLANLPHINSIVSN